jgi:hypothetical protein
VHDMDLNTDPCCAFVADPVVCSSHITADRMAGEIALTGGQAGQGSAVDCNGACRWKPLAGIRAADYLGGDALRPLSSQAVDVIPAAGAGECIAGPIIR